MVVAHHYYGFEAGYSGVGFFFVLSGYVLAINYRPEDFYLRRFARIYPTHLLTLVATVPFGVSGIVPNLTLLQSWIPNGYFTMNDPAWSISNEAFFYLLMPFIFARVSLKAVVIAFATLLTFAFAWTIIHPDAELANSTLYFFYILPITRLPEFMLGILLAKSRKLKVGLAAEVAVGVLAVVSITAVYMPVPPAFAASLIFVPASAAIVWTFANSDGPVSRVLLCQSL